LKKIVKRKHCFPPKLFSLNWRQWRPV